MRTILLFIVGLATLVVIYASIDTLGEVSDVALAARDLLFPSAKKDPPPVAATIPAPLSELAAKFQNSLMIMDDGTPRALEPAKLVGVKYWAFYYSASWCPPCRAFTPDLVSFYNDFKPSHPDFELIFVNEDRSEDDMLNYMKDDAMPWPAVWYSDIDNPDLEARKYGGAGIPCLVLVDADGQVLSDTFQYGQYTDPHHVIDDIRTMVK